MKSASSQKLAKVCKKMHRRVFDGERINLHQVMKDAYDNFTWIYKSTISRLQYLEMNRPYYGFEYRKLEVALGFLITFSRCTLKWCVEKGTGAINRSLIDILSDVESYFVRLHEYCTTKQYSLWGLHLFERTARFEHLVSRISDAFECVFSTQSSPASTDFMDSDESMVEFLDQVVDNLYQCDMVDKNIKLLIEKLGFLRNCLEFTKERWMSPGVVKELLIYIEGFAERAASYSFMTKYGKRYLLKINHHLEPKMGIAVSKAFSMKLQQSDNLPPLTDVLLKGYVDCVQENLTELVLSSKNQFEDLRKQLELLMGLVLNYPPKHEAELEKFSDIRWQFQALVVNVGSALFLYLNEEMMATELSLVISDFLEKFDLLKGRIIHIFLFATFDRIGRYSPQTNQLGFLNFLIGNLRELKEDSTFNLKETYEAGGFQAIQDDLVLLRSFLQNTVGHSTADDRESKDLISHISGAAHVAEYFINSYVASACPDWCRSRWFCRFKQQMTLIKATFEDISEKRSDNGDNTNIAIVTSSRNPSHVRSLGLLPTSEVVVGFEEEIELIKERLVSDLRKLDVISIIGMGGLGKTTFAKKLYEDPSIVDNFQIRAWCYVSQEYNKKELLLTLIGSISELTDLMRRQSDGDLSAVLYKKLKGNRYLIVMDDIWGMDAFKDLKRFFPDNGNGSRIMLTSRNRLEDYSNPLELRLLTREESWDLLKQKVYDRDEECPLQLCEVGTKIAEKCRGLPLAIVVIAGILSKSKKDGDFWEQVAGNLSLYITGGTQGQVMAALELSYELLPDHLKPLFLYLGAFPEDTEIPTDKLTWLWIAEGFVHKTDYHTDSLEIQAELNLIDLIDRNLVMTTERRSDGRVKSCRVHDLLRDMCLEKAKEENFMQQINVHNDIPDPVTYERRLSISLNRRYNDTPMSPRPFFACRGLPMLPIPPPVSSFLFFNMNKTLPLSEEDIKSIFRDFKLLRILHSESITIDENIYRDHVILLIHLRYVSIRADWNSIPTSISKLWNLETLIVKGLGGEILVPHEIWTLVKLRHLHINYRANFNGALLHDSSSMLEKLQTLSTPVVCCGEEKKLIQRVPNLRKFRFISDEAKNSNGNFEYQLPQLESLDQLESLKILCHTRTRCVSGRFGFPSTLKKLTLSKFRLQWSEISSFGQKLPNLEVLKLRGGSFEGTLWDMEDVEFSKLKFLKLESLNIKQWIVTPENFPCLKKLVLQSCKKLEEIPSSVGDFYSLEKIQLSWCTISAANSANKILEEQRDAGNELLKVFNNWNDL